jgi:glyoxylase-like metal-dependent hydrolase (beta-lactamase superfamily II)
MSQSELVRRDIAHLRAPNPGPFTLTGTNTWLVGRDPAYVIDPGPTDATHIDAIATEALARGGLGAIVLTHDHHDHSDGVAMLRARLDAPLAAARGDVELRLADGAELGPLRVVATPGHAPDHLAYIAGGACFTGDAVLGEGSVFVAPDPGAMAGYLEALRRLRQLPLELLCPGHGPVVLEPHAKLDEYLAHRLDRERRLVEALDDGLRTVDELLDRVWDDAPSELRIAAAVTLEAHLQKLDAEGRLPNGVERRTFDWLRDARTL